MNAAPIPRDYVAPPDALAGRAVLITGASQGLGRAVARAAARAGAAILALGRDVAGLDALADEFAAAGLPEPVLVPFNLEGAKLGDYHDLAALIGARYGHLDGLVLNAAILGEMAPIAHYDPMTWARVFQVNVHSQFLLVQSCLPLLAAAPEASIVFTASAVGRRGRAYWGAYAAAKFACEGLMQTLADECGDGAGIRVNSLNPGGMRTRMRALAYPAEDPRTLPDPATIAPAFVYLLSAASRHLHGAALNAQ